MSTAHGVATSVGEPVLEADRTLLVGDAFEDACCDQVPEPALEDIAGDPEPSLEVVEPAHPQERVADDQQAPPLAHHLEALRESGFNRTATAARLGISLRQIRYRIARLNIAVPNDQDPHDDQG